MLKQTAKTTIKSPADLQREEKAAPKIARLLEENFLAQGAQIYSSLHKNQVFLPETDNHLDILLKFPSGETFAIAVISLKGERDTVFYDHAAQKLRYRHGKVKKRWLLDPTVKIRQQVDSLSGHTDLFEKDQPPSLIVVLTSPVRVKVWEDVAAQVGDLTVLYLNGVYVIEEKNLIALIELLKSA